MQKIAKKERACESCGISSLEAKFSVSSSGRPENKCNKCRYLKRKNQFLNNKELHEACKEKQREWGRKPENKERARANRFLSTYGLSPEVASNLARASTSSLCQICKTKPRRCLFVDHDHETGLVRGLICENCNFGIGLMRDDCDKLLLAAEYLEGFKNAKM